MQIKNILLINVYSSKNLGDSGIVLSMIAFLRDYYPGANIQLMSSSYIENKKFYDAHDVECVEPPWIINPSKSFGRKYLEGTFNLIKLLLGGKTQVFQSFKNADIAISVGGGYLYSSVKGPLGVGFLNILFNYFAAIKLSKCVVGFPQSIGPFHWKIDKIITKYVLKKVDRIYARETLSSTLYSELKNCEIFPDIALYKSLNILEKHSCLQSTKCKVGVTVLDWRFAKKNTNNGDIDKYINNIAGALSSLNNYKMIDVAIYPQVDVGSNDSDTPISNKLFETLSNFNISCNVVSLKEFTHSEIIKEYGSCNLFIASRMHSAIFSINSGVAPIALVYQPKTKGTMEIVGLSENCLEINNFKESELFELCKKNIGARINYKYPAQELAHDLNKLVHK